MPELFCGLARAQDAPPIAYPVACLPQALVAGSPFMLLQACLGVRVDGWTGEIHVARPRLPRGVDELRLHGIEVAGDEVGLVFRRAGDRIGVFTESRSGIAVPLKLRH